MLNLFGKKAKKPVDSIADKNKDADNSLLPKDDLPQKPEIPQVLDENSLKDSIDEKSEKRVHNLIILDESGSMSSIYNAALSGVNETLQTIRMAQEEHKKQRHFVSLITFDSGHYNKIYCNTPAEKAVDITKDQYRPGGCTPLYDAMGRAINELHPIVGKDDIVLVTIITDGYENASREYDGKAIKSLVERMKAEGWVLTYIGANQDVEAVAASLSISNSLSFEANEEGTNAMFEKERRSRTTFFSKVNACFMDSKSLDANYFDDDFE